MPTTKPASVSRISAQVRNDLLKGIEQAIEAHTALDASMHSVEALAQEAALGVSEHHAKVKALLERMSTASPELKIVAEMRRLQTAFNKQYLLLQLNMQHENRTYTSVSNVLKTRHDTVKNSIGNIR